MIESFIPSINYPKEIVPPTYLNAAILNMISIIFYYLDITNVDAITISLNFSGSPFTNNMIEAILKDHISHASVHFVTEVLDDSAETFTCRTHFVTTSQNLK